MASMCSFSVVKHVKGVKAQPGIQTSRSACSQLALGAPRIPRCVYVTAYRESALLDFEYFQGVSVGWSREIIEARLPEVSTDAVEAVRPWQAEALRDQATASGMFIWDLDMSSASFNSIDWDEPLLRELPAHDTVDLHDLPMKHAQKLYEF